MKVQNILITNIETNIGKAIYHHLNKYEWFNVFVLANNDSTHDYTIMNNIYYLNINSSRELKHVCFDINPDFIINTYDFNDLLECENNKLQAWKENASIVEELSKICRLIDSHLIIFSSDQIFDGKNGPYSELDFANPINYYGKTKLAGENYCRKEIKKHSIIRYSKLVNNHKFLINDFIDDILDCIINNQQISFPVDYFFSPTYLKDIAIAVAKIINTGKTGTYNVSAPELIRYSDVIRLISNKFDIKYKEPKYEFDFPVKIPEITGFIILKSLTDLNIKLTGLEEIINEKYIQYKSGGYID